MMPTDRNLRGLDPAAGTPRPTRPDIGAGAGPGRRFVLTAPLLILPLAALSACGPKIEPPPILTLTIQGSADQNPTPAGTAQPLEVRIYQLGSTSAFDRAVFFALTNQEQLTLGPSDLGSDTYVIAPGATKTIVTQLKPGVQAIGVAALFQQIDTATWRAHAPAAPHGPTKLMLKISKLAISLAPSS